MAGSFHPSSATANGHPGVRTTSSSSSSASLKGCCCCLFFLLILLGLVVVAVCLVIILAVRPKKPQFELQAVQVQYLLVEPPPQSPSSPTSPSLSSSSPVFLSLNISMFFTALNPNRVGIKYGPSKLDVMYKGVPLGVASVPSFYQPAHSTTLVTTTVTVRRANILQAAALDLEQDATVNDRVELLLTGDVAAQVRLLQINSPQVKVYVDCAIVISPRKQSLTYKQCGVNGLNV
ncbi:hypothetical protein AMTRI_Chr04g184100 [Amborella trichopoda]|uniref:Late embryogenesis abundant protein LEA-2 subgroup domain-containing protein n=1 Tax=Amborella trichopoda TaxID=13333 RepID=W1NS56_AMBTC|nr:NDR1/HIN1-like protein 2 [Amborella trichopoda]ERM97609.1 hypothetical protein AMTR_s00173p00048690 [Amborella trichopoda]|eukprot:XP_006830193.1 NDR1/HIN1-like protein 2 [Amborella trichopoda]